ncbi:unnamed protein product [Didymodactylos carnosus]|uniref:Uncharacterized protein n=1 Tax=Didymodactylos carnosus TaxID=1234261 RepID=A0A814URM2_9BILA|nr:unnamed protein product [Didymodactylos carnosus]CAF1178261.1 unnamed protein product [Didymodactylos carnosus]CAF3854012.1 unnamed protein product [Didymodactylos carnosus]CAF3942397.1 unnamed protein product [Didymodactylos carnosus]
MGQTQEPLTVTFPIDQSPVICEISSCPDGTFGYCLHCKRYLCINHLKDHEQELVEYSNTVGDNINLMRDNVEHLNTEIPLQNSIKTLNDWYEKSTVTLDTIYNKNLARIFQYNDELNNNLRAFQNVQTPKFDQIHNGIKDIQKHRTTNINEINRLQKNLDETKKELDTLFYDIKTECTAIDSIKLVQVKKVFETQVKLPQTINTSLHSNDKSQVQDQSSGFRKFFSNLRK